MKKEQKMLSGHFSDFIWTKIKALMTEATTSYQRNKKNQTRHFI